MLGLMMVPAKKAAARAEPSASEKTKGGVAFHAHRLFHIRMSYKRPESVLVVVYTARGQVLRLRRNDPPDFWQSVTGSLQEGESPAAAAHRELREETGIDAWPESTGTVNTYSILPTWRHRFAPDVSENTEHVFHLRLDARLRIVLNPEEHSDYRWLDIEAAAALAISPTDADAIRNLPRE